MSFGFGVGDFITVGNLCWKSYKRVKESPGNYRELASEVSGLFTVIKETEELLLQQEVTSAQQAKLRPCTEGCEGVLNDLNGLLTKYDSLGTKSQKTFDRIGMGLEDMAAIRLRLISNVSMLDAFNNASSHARLENKLNQLITEVRAGKREGSVVSVQTFNTAAHRDRETWEALRRELEDIGISPSVINEKRQFIINWFQEAVAAGQLDEDTPSEGSDDSAYDSDSLDDRDEGEVPASSARDVDDQRQVHSAGVAKKSQFERDLMTGLDLRDVQSQRKARATRQGRRFADAYPVSSPSDSVINNHSHKNSTVSGQMAEDSSYRYTAGLREKAQDDTRRTRKLEKPGGMRQRISYLVTSLQGRDQQLEKAIKSKDPFGIRLALEKGANMQHKDSLGFTMLSAAVKTGSVSTVRVLLDHGANIQPERGVPPLALAALHGHIGLVRVLLDYGAGINANSPDSFTPLCAAASVRCGSEIMWFLLGNGANIESTTYDGRTALMIAASEGLIENVQILVEKGADTRVRNSRGHTTLMVAASGGHVQVATLLLEKGANVESKASDGSTALILAARANAPKMVPLLVKEGADTEAKALNGVTALLEATSRGNVEVVRALIEHGAKINQKDELGHTALNIAAKHTNYEIKTLLLHAGASPLFT